jgi:nucleotide-binding universal stress UspA family protein
MRKYLNILVAYDGSDSGRNALKQAIRLQKEADGCRVRVLNVIYPFEADTEFIGTGDIHGALREAAEKILEEAREIARAEGGTIDVEIRQGLEYECIVEAADAEKCDLVVVGRRGIRRIERMLVGSVASRVIGHTERDVLVVPGGSNIGWDNVLLATDGSEYSRMATDHAIQFTRSYGGDLSVVSVVDVNDEIYALAPETVERLENHAREVIDEVGNKANTSEVKTFTHLREGDADEKINELAAETKADVIFMGSHGRKAIKRLLMGSVTERVIGHTRVPVFVVKG